MVTVLIWLTFIGSSLGQDTSSDSSKVNKAVTVGAGISIYLDNVETFKYPEPGDTVLVMENNSRVHPSLITGMILDTRHRYWSIITSINFDMNGSKKLLDGFIIGIGYHVNEDIALTVGYGIRRTYKLRYSFMHKSQKFIQQNKIQSRYAMSVIRPHFTSSDTDQLDLTTLSRSLFDGAPLNSTNPLVESFSHSIFIGIVPLKLNSIFSNESDD